MTTSFNDRSPDARIPRIKICGVRGPGDVEAVVGAGVDAAGFLVGQVHTSPDFVSPAVARGLAAGLAPTQTPVLVTHRNGPTEVLALLRQTGFPVAQLHGAPGVEQVRALRKSVGDAVTLILAVHVVGDRVMGDWRPFHDWIDAVILDTADPATDRVGGTGKPHDWSAAAAFRGKCPLPCLLAGGLTPENVADAIRTVAPYGVDVNSGVETPAGRKSPDRCRLFATNARILLS